MTVNLSTHYVPQLLEQKWYARWLQQKLFHSQPNPTKTPYTIIMPPPNVTGVLHMGHVLNNTIQDVLARKARMEGKEVCWVPGLDHASIATEAKVVALLREKGIRKQDLTREEFLKHAWEWKNKYGGIIFEQLKKLGVSCDWDRACFTMDPSPSAAVTEVFVRLYEAGHIYRGHRMIHWDPQGRTALADDEVIYRTTTDKLYYIRYEVVDTEDTVTVATTRPETLLGDTAVCIHPNDPRYQHLKGKSVRVPLVDRLVPIIEDTYVSMEFGTGCLKVTPAHDANDYELARRHHLPHIDVLNEDGTLNENAQLYIGEDRFAARQKIVLHLQETGHLVKAEAYEHNVGYSERTDAVVEPRLSTQWFVRMQELAKPALDSVMQDTIQFYPPKLKNTYRAWMENVRDWCVSRQLWWGHRIPAYYLADGTVVVANTLQEAVDKARTLIGQPALTENDLTQDPDVLDTWFSSALWPISVFDGFKDPDNPDISYYYPTDDLVTAPEIIFFWVARMIMTGYAFRNTPPFKNVYFTGIVRDKLGRKMSKSLGNSPDVLALMDQYGADGTRAGMLFSAVAGNDLLFDEQLCLQGRNFANKIWNALRLVKGWITNEDTAPSKADDVAIEWFEARSLHILHQINENFRQFRISEAFIAIYKLVWDDFCALYLEMVKPPYEHPIAKATYEATLVFFERLLKMLHPFMPFITEEAWHILRERSEHECIATALWPTEASSNEHILQQSSLALELISRLRALRVQNNFSTKHPLPLYAATSAAPWLAPWAECVQKIGLVSEITYVEEAFEHSLAFQIDRYAFGIPHVHQEDAAQSQEAIRKELIYLRGFLERVNNKLNNDKFVRNAPAEVIANERKKQEDAKAKIALLEQRERSVL